MDKKTARILIAKVRLALDAVPVRTETECMHKAVAYQGLRELEQMTEEVEQDGEHSAAETDPDRHRRAHRHNKRQG